MLAGPFRSAQRLPDKVNIKISKFSESAWKVRGTARSPPTLHKPQSSTRLCVHTRPQHLLRWQAPEGFLMAL